MTNKIDVAAYIWPAYTGQERRSLIFWEQGEGEWQTVRSAQPKFEGHTLPRIPLLGYKDEALPETMEEQIDLAVSHGVNVFIYDWYWYDRRPFLENCLNDGFLKAGNRDQMKFYLMWANHNANYTWDKRIAEVQDTVVWQGDCDRTQFDIVCDRIIEKYFCLPEYYRIDDKPVFAIYDIDNLVKGLGGIEETKEALQAFREKAEAAGLPGIHLQMILWGEFVHNFSGVDSEHLLSSEIAKRLGFDSTTNYQYCHFTDIDRPYREVFEDVKVKWEEFSNLGLPYYPHVSIGWDNNPRFQSFRPGIMTENSPEELEKAFAAARAYAEEKGAGLVTINSWNEWTEMSYLLPDQVNGTGYLEAVKKVFSEE